MSQNAQWDSIQLDPLHIPYNIVQNDLDTSPRLVEGSLNSICTFGGALKTRNGLATSNTSTPDGRIDRLWYYETLLPLTSTGYVAQYVLASVKKTATGRWSLYYAKMGLTGGTSTAFTEVAALGEIRESTAPHEVIITRGKAYIKSFPRSTASDKYGLYTWSVNQADTKTVSYWGVVGPTVPAKLTGVSGRRTNTYASATDTFIYVGQTVIGAALPATPFTATIDLEQVTVTAIATNTPVAGTDRLTVTRGVNNTIATEHFIGTLVLYRNWTASGHNITAEQGWKYSYCWKNLNGHYSNRAPLQTNPDAVPSMSGPVASQIPKIEVTCPSDTTNYPSILILRTQDGGGTFWPLTEIDNPGTATTTFEDKYYPSGATAISNNLTYDGPIYSRIVGVTFADPIDDEYLIQDQSGPGLDTNSPLPGVTPPLVFGTDTPTRSTSLAYFKGRIWVGVENTLFFTSREELPYGIPEEACNTSGDRGNYIRFQEKIAQIYAVKDALLVFTRKGRILRITGSLKETFTPEIVAGNIGFAMEHPHAICEAEDKIFFVSQDYQVYMMDENSQRIISHPLKNTISDFVTAATGGSQIQLAHYKTGEISWLVLGLFDQGTPANSRVLVYDLYKSQRLNRNYSDNIERAGQQLHDKMFDFWNSPWTIPASAMIACPANDGAGNNKMSLWFAISGAMRPYSLNDYALSNDGTLANVDWNFVLNFNLMEVPNGNHVNQLRVPGVRPSGYALMLERLYYGPDADPDVRVYIDDLWDKPEPVKTVRDQYTTRSVGFRIMLGMVNKIGKYFSLKISKDRPKVPINLQKIAVIFDPESGT